MAEKRDNSGVAFPNKERRTEKHPNLSGPGMINGVEGRMALWTKVDRNGNKFLTWSWTPNDEADQRRHDEGSAPADDSDIPYSPDGFDGPAWR